MADIDPSIALNANRPQPANPLQQAMQVQQLKYLQANTNNLQQSMAANQAIGQIIQKNTDANGNVDTAGVQRDAASNPLAAYGLQSATGTNLAQSGQQTANQSAKVQLSQQQLDTAKSHLGWAYQSAIAVANNPKATPGDVFQALGEAVKNGQITPQIASQALSDMPGSDAPAGALHAWAANHAAQAAGAASQLGITLPGTGSVDTGSTITPTNTDRITGAVTPSSPGFAKTLSPEGAAQRVPTFQNGQPGTVSLGSITPGSAGGGASRSGDGGVPPLPPGMMTNAQDNGTTVPLPSDGPQGSPASAGAAPQGFLPSGPSMGTADAAAGSAATVNNHWQSLSNDATNAQTNIGLAQNIKAFADQAATGKYGDKLAAVNGLLSIFGQPGQTDLNTATDLLNKNMARLSLSSRAGAGGTDAAGALATAANPHGAMTAAAIKDAADQVIGTQQMALAEQKVLQPYKIGNDVAGYQQALTKFNNAADPRIWQFANMSPEERGKFKASMSAADQKAFSGKIKTMEQLGAIQ